MTVSTQLTPRRRHKPGYQALAAACLVLSLLVAGCSPSLTDLPSSVDQTQTLGRERVVQLGFDAGGEVLFVTGRHTENALAPRKLHGLVGLSLPEALDLLLTEIAAGGCVIADLDSDTDSLTLKLSPADGNNSVDGDSLQQHMGEIYQRLALPVVTHTLPAAQTSRPEAEVSFAEARSIAELWIGVEGTTFIFQEEELEYRDGTLFYAFTVLARDRLFELEIDASSGELLELYERPCSSAAARHDDDGAYAVDDSRAADTAAVTGTTDAPPSFSLAEARTLASVWIGVTEAELVFTAEALKYKSGTLYYELVAVAGREHYLFQIDAFDGEVLQFEQVAATAQTMDDD